MKTDFLNSPTDGNNGYKNTQFIPNPSFTGPDVIAQSNPTTNTPAVKVTKTTQQALDYYKRIGNNCNCR